MIIYNKCLAALYNFCLDLLLIVHWFQGPLVYVNYAEVNDFLYLTTNLSLNLTGHICIARYGAIYRGDKVCTCIQ